ncbi:MAG: hypothetical protein MJ117_06155 [Lachnospiraceae bacterium]|nr:hypothetical protein [Lachnospiraceae bacterium]
MKKHTASKLLALVLSVSVLLGSSLPVMAAEKSDEAVVTESAEEVREAIDLSGAEEMESVNAVMPVGDLQLMEVDEEKTGQLVDDATIKKIDRAMRAYTPSKESLMVNKAKHFYYYEKLNAEEQDMYDAMLMACDDPANAMSGGLHFTTIEPFGTKFWEQYRKVYYALTLDHAELFWLYNDNDTSFVLYSTGQDTKGKYGVYFELANGVKNYEQKMKDFNKAVKSFLKEIDTSKESKTVARAIHDKLTDLVSYDYQVCDEGIYSDYAHTAFGALVHNSRGGANIAVCDGYALAYEYLCQQVGITANVIYGMAGNTKNELGGHAWSMVKVDKAWKEVDACWDDVGTRVDAVKQYCDKNSDAYKVYMEAYKDKEYGKKLGHYLYRVSTKKISHYTPPADDVYVTKDGRFYVSCLTESYHVRDKDGASGLLMKLAPIAD